MHLGVVCPQFGEAEPEASRVMPPLPGEHGAFTLSLRTSSWVRKAAEWIGSTHLGETGAVSGDFIKMVVTRIVQVTQR